jgi:hypothetical protein
VSRYFIRAASPADDEWSNWVPDPLIPHLDVPDHVSAYTGLIDRHGNAIWRGPNPIGFHKPREKA